MNNHASKNNLIKAKKNEKITLSGEDFREGLTAIISIKVAEPQFEGQTKTKLGNGDVKGIVDKAVYEGILDFLEQNPSIGRRIVEKALLAARSRSAAKKARELIENLKTLIPRQNFEVSIQGCVGSKVLASTSVRGYRKDVTAKLYGGDVTRKMKLLKKQKEGKKRMKKVGNVDIPKEAFYEFMMPKK